MANKITPLLILALFLSLTIKAQPQQPTPAYTFQSEVSTGANIGGYEITATTTIDTVVMNDAGGIVMAAHKGSGGTGSDRTAVFTPKRLVAQEGAVVDGKPLVRIATSVIAINNVGQVGYEALWGDPTHGNKLQAAVFVDDRFAVAFQPFASGDATDFELTDDGQVLLKNLPPPAAKRPWLTPSTIRDTRNFQRQLIDRFAPRKDWQLLWGASRSADDVYRDEASRPKAPAKQADKTASDASAAAELPGAAKSSCKLPAFPLPPEWILGADIAGPVASHVFEAPAKITPYESQVYGRLTSPFRTVQYSEDCRALVILVGDASAPARMEIHTPAGLLTYKKPDGSFELPGVTERITSGPFTKADAVYRVNRKGQLILPVKLSPEGFALLLATPINGAN